jgi:hypothetical protein
MLGWAPFGCLIVGLLYLASLPATASQVGRIASVSYAPASALVYLILALSAPTGRSWALSPTLFFAVQAMPLLLMGIGVVLVRQPKWVHYVLVPVALVCMTWQFAWSYWGVYGK